VARIVHSVEILATSYLQCLYRLEIQRLNARLCVFNSYTRRFHFCVRHQLLSRDNRRKLFPVNDRNGTQCADRLQAIIAGRRCSQDQKTSTLQRLLLIITFRPAGLMNGCIFVTNLCARFCVVDNSKSALKLQSVEARCISLCEVRRCLTNQ